MNPRPDLAPECLLAPPAGDGRPPLADVYSAFASLGEAGWRTIEITSQPAADGRMLPILAYVSAEDVDIVLIGGIHGREPAGPLALARSVPHIVEQGRTQGLLVMPLLNPWGYLHDERYGPSGQSVTDSDHALGRRSEAACAEAAAIIGFVMGAVRIRRGAGVLDLHEDPLYEAPGDGVAARGSYLYVIGARAMDQPACRRGLDCLDGARLPLVRTGTTRFGETLVDGVVLDSADGSIDELLAVRLGCSPVITVENTLRAPNEPPLSVRVDQYVEVLEAFLGASAGEVPCARRS